MRLIIITGTCGAGKSTMKDELAPLLDPERFACIDNDEVGLNWWDYAGTEHESRYAEDSLKQAVRMAAGRDLVFVTCMAPHDYMTKTAVPEEVESTFFIALWASDETIVRRLRARPAERGFTTDEAIRPHIGYNQWIGRNRGKYQLFIDNGKQAETETAKIIRDFIDVIPAGRGKVRNESVSGCVFCQIVSGKIPAMKVFEDGETLAFMDVAKDVDGHILVIPKKHCGNVTDCDPETLNAVTRTVRTVSAHLVSECGYEGVNLLNASGGCAGQSVPHFHIHVIPRRPDDGIDAWPRFDGAKQETASVFDKVKM